MVHSWRSDRIQSAWVWTAGPASLLEIALDFSNVTFAYLCCEEWHSLRCPSPLCFMILWHWIATLGCHILTSCLDYWGTDLWETLEELTNWRLQNASLPKDYLVFSFFPPLQESILVLFVLWTFPSSPALKLVERGPNWQKHLCRCSFLNELCWTGDENLFYKRWRIDDGLIGVIVCAFVLLLLMI